MTTTKTAEDGGAQPHTGQMFLALPDGSARLYKLEGTSGEPLCAGQVAIETPAKKACTTVLKVENWLHETQRLDVTVELTEKASPATFIVAANATEVNPKGTKEFPVRFVSFSEGVSKGRITFTNPVTGEYTFYELTAKTTMAEVVESIAIESPCRQTARYLISVENPLPVETPVAMVNAPGTDKYWACDSSEIRLKELKPLSGNAEGSFEVEYRPLAPTKQPSEHMLQISTKELGTFQYKLTLKAGPPLMRQTLRFNVPLGTMQSEQFVFHAFNQTKADYQCSVTKPDFFSVQKSLVVEPVAAGWDGNDVILNVMFEPTEIGEVRDTMTVASKEGGEYVCELVANCIAPIPRGPFNFEQGAVTSLDIPFRNCFTSSSAWNFAVDNPAFRVATATATVNSKTEGKVTVLFEPTEENVKTPGGFIMGKLFVTCAAQPSISPWVFYLKAKVDPSLPLAAAGGGKKK